MKLLLVADGDLLRRVYFKDLSRFFLCKLTEMSAASAADLSKADLVLIDFDRATPRAIQHLKAAASKNKSLKILCIVTKGDRWAPAQAAAFGQVTTFERENGLRSLVGTIRDLFAAPQFDRSRLQHLDRDVQVAFGKANDFLNEMPFALTPESDFPTRLMMQAATSVTDALHEKGIGPWVGAVESHHSHTYRHSLYVAGLVTSFSQSLGWNRADQYTMAAAGLVHDIGKTKIPLAILDKPGKLTNSEFDLIKKHPVFGYEILHERQEVPDEIKHMTFHHHEFMDGSGYPEGLKADELHPMVRVMTICDIFAALTEKRSYKEALSPRVAYTELMDMGGKLDQSLVRKFTKVVTAVANKDVGGSGAFVKAEKLKSA